MKKNRTCVDSTLEELSKLQSDVRLTCRMKDQIQSLEMELGFLKMSMWWLIKLNGALFSIHKHSGYIRKSHIKSTIAKARKGLYQSAVNALDKGEFAEWDDLVSQLLNKIQQCYPEMAEYDAEVFDYLENFRLSTSEIQQSLEFNFTLLGHFFRNNSDNLLLILDCMKRKAIFSVKLLQFTRKACRYPSEKLITHIKSYVFYLTHTHILASRVEVEGQTEEDKASRLEKFLSSMLNNFLPHEPDFMNSYIEILTASKEKSSTSNVLSMGEILFDLVDLFLQSPTFNLKKDIVDNLSVAFIFLISFLVDPGVTNKSSADEKLILIRAKDVLSDISYYITSQIEEDDTEKSNILILPPDLMQKIITVKAEVRNIYTRDVSKFHFPMTDIPGSIDSLLIDLKEMLKSPPCSSTSFLKHQVSIVQDEFLTLRPLLRNVLQLQNEPRGLEDFWIRISNVSYHARDVVNSLFHVSDSVWQDIICLSDVMEEIKQIKCDIEKIQQDHQMYDAPAINTEFSSGSLLPLQVDTSRIKELVVQLKDEEDDIIDRLLRGTSKLHIIAICGTGGLGKTTLARKVYNDPSVQSYFHKYAWCTVSQTYRSEKILLDILSQITSDEVSKMKEADLAMKLYQSLKGQRYLIIVDDIWDIKAWDVVQLSFPDDGNGSRIIFTTRIHDLVKFDSTIRPLRPLRNYESWELLQMKLFQKDGCPPNFTNLGKQIADDCKGLPLAIVLIAGLLSRDVNNLNWWKQIANNLGSQIASEGGMAIVELSYKHLPEFLKPCFLYFGVFQEDKVIRVQKLIQLWISEGFVQEYEKKLLEDVAMKYLMDLVARSLVTITKRSSKGGIKECGIHDLLREFCLKKAEKEIFLQVVHENDDSNSSWQALCKHYRLCIQTNEWISIFNLDSSHPGIHSLLFSPDNTFGSFKWDTNFSLRKFKFLLLLDLEDVTVLGCFPEEIVVLYILRYLAIRCINTSIPSSVANLRNLEFFRVKGTQPELRLPDTIWKMKRLRHIDVGTCIISSEMFCQLDNVQSFSIPCISYGEDVQNLLRRIPGVRKLRCELRQSSDSDKKGNTFSVLNFLSELESLNVTYIGRQLYDCDFQFPSTLTKLTLSKFRLPWIKIAAIGMLQNLEVLKLLENAFKGECWTVSDGEFTNLKFLKLSKLNLREWNVSSDALPCLQRLVIEQCKTLEEIPASFGDSSTLMMIQVHWCSFKAESSAKQILRDQLELGNENFDVNIIENQSETIISEAKLWDL